MADVTLNIRHNAAQAAPAVGQLANEMGRMATQSKSAATAGTAAANGFNKIGAACLNVGKSAKTGASGLSKFVSSLGRIAYYRLIRTSIKYVGDAFREGLKAAYAFSKANQPADYAKLAGAMDGIKKAASTMSLQLGAAFGGLITAIAPVLIRIINLVTAAADAITRFFAVLNGSGYYKKAASGFEEVGASAGGAGKKIKGLLASWDELNVIGKESGGGGGGSSAVDYSGAYEWVPAQSELATAFLEGNLGKVGEIIGRQLREWGEKIDEWFGKYFGNDYDYWKSGLEGLVDLFSGILRGLGFDAAAYNLELFAEKVKAVFGLISEYTNAFSEALENSKINIFFLSIEKFFLGLERDFKALALSLATDIQNSVVLRKIFGDQSEYIFKLDAEVYDAEEELAKIDKKIEELKVSGDNGINVDAHVDHEKVDQYKETLKKPWAVEIAPQLKEEFTQNISDWLHGTGGGHNDGVYSTGNGLALTLSVIPSLGDRSKFVEGMEQSVTRHSNPWRAWTDAVMHDWSHVKEYMGSQVERHNRPWRAWTDAVMHDWSHVKEYMGSQVEKHSNPWRAWTDAVMHDWSNVSTNMEKNVTKTSNPWQALVDPKYGSDKTFFSTFDEKITGKTHSTIVNPKLSVPQKYEKDMGDLTDAKTVDIKPKLTDAKAFKEQLQDALKASASIKTTVSGTTKTIGKVSMSEYAQGGWPNIGDLFIANEAGPELVGTIGGSTAVANNDDIVQGIQGGVERANAEQNELIRQQNSILMQLLNKDLTISPSVALGQVMARSAALYGRA